MSKPKWNYVVDVVMFGLMGAIIFIGVLMGFFLASGPVVDEGSKYAWGLHRHQWGDIHTILSFAFVAFFILHLLLHWSWIKGATKKLLRSPSVLVVILLLPALLILVAWSFSEKDSLAYAEFGNRSGSKFQRAEEAPPPVLPREEVAVEKKKVKQVEINGRMSLADVEKATGISAKKIAQELNLPKDASLDQNLGQMRRRYGFQLQQVRDLVSRLSGGKIEAIDSDAAPSKAQPAHSRRGKQEQGGLRQQEINGRLTLGDIQRMTGVPASAIINKLNLPANTPLNERLGRLRKRHGFSLQQARDAVSALKKK
jgi:hypothetical protein